MLDNYYKDKLILDIPLVCITSYESEGVIRHGINIRFYAGEDSKDHKMFTNGSSKDKCNIDKRFINYMYFHEFKAIVPLYLFNAKRAANNIDYYLTNYKI